MKINTSGYFFRSHLENRLFNQNTLRLDHEIDIRCLKTAWKAALHDCPFFDQGLRSQDGELIFIPHESTGNVEGFTDTESGKHPAALEGDLAWTCAMGDRLKVGVSHALTDECGKKLFTCLLLYHYFQQTDNCAYPHPYADENGALKVWDTETDLLEDSLFPFPGKKPEVLIPTEVFQFPEQLAPGKREAVFRIKVNAKAFYQAVRNAFPISEEAFQKANERALPIGKLQCVFVYLLLGRVIVKLHPSQPRPITLRSPVNTRSLCGKEDALRNFSMPQAALMLTPEQLKRALRAEDVHGMLQGLEEQLTPDAMGWQLSALKERIRTGALDPDVAALYHQSMIVTNVGKEYYEPSPGRVLEDNRYAAGGYPFAVYLNRVGEDQIITISQSFETESYFRGFLEELRGSGIPEEAIRE